MTETTYEPVRVHVASVEPGVQAAPAPHTGRGIATGKTVVLTATNPYDQILAQDRSRLYALIQVFDNQAVLCYSEAQADNSANSTSALPGPDGTLVPTGVVLPVKCSNAVWVTSAAYPTRVSVLAVYPD